MHRETNVVNTADFAWLTNNSSDLYRKYAGKWIAVHDGKVIGVGDTAIEAATLADTKQPDGDYILEALDPVGDVV